MRVVRFRIWGYYILCWFRVNNVDAIHYQGGDCLQIPYGDQYKKEVNKKAEL